MSQSLLARPSSQEDVLSLIARTRNATILDSRVPYEEGEDSRNLLPTTNDPMYQARLRWGWQHVEITDIIMSLERSAALLESQASDVVLEGTRQTLQRDANRTAGLADEWRTLAEEAACVRMVKK